MTPPVFCGRERELAELERAWQAVRSGGGPQLVVLLAESGVGKTRLVQEFYARLAATYRGEGGGYWPARLDQQEQNLVVNPAPEACDPAFVMPFLWWGVRLVDPAGRNQLLGGAVGAHVGALTPHLQPMYRARRQQQRLHDAGRTLASTLVGSIPIVGGLAGYGEVAFELFQLGREARQERTLAPGEAAAQGSKGLNERILDDLRRLFQPDGGAARVPAVLVIDDAHFSPADPGAVELIGGMLRATQANTWPLLLIVTHWEREWHQQLADPAPSVARRIDERFALLQPSWRPTPVRPLPGGELAPLLRAGLPGLSEEQARQLLARADGNPRFLDEIVRFAQRRARWFEGRDPGNALTPEGLAAILAESTDLHRLVEARLYEAPELVRATVSLSGLQGVRFLAPLSRELLARLATPPEGGTAAREAELAEALAQAATPHAFVNLLSERLGEFSQRVFFEVARTALDDLVDADDARDALRSILRELDGEGLGLAPEELAIFHALRAEVLGASEAPTDRSRALTSLAALVQGALERFDYREAARAAERIVAGDGDGRWSLDDLGLARSQYVIDALAEMGRLPDALRLALRMRDAAEAAVEGAPEGAAAAGSSEARRNLSVACEKVGNLLRAQGDLDGALQHFARSLELARARADELVTPQAFRDLAIAFEKVGDVFQAQGHLDAALEVFERSLEITRELAVEPATAPERRDLAVALDRVGNLLHQRGDLAGALERYRPALELSRALADELGTPGARQNLNVALERVGNLLWDRGELDGALERYRPALELSRALADELGTPGARRSLGVALQNVGNVLRIRGDLDGALEHYHPLLEISQQLAAELGTRDAQRDLAIALDQVGAALQARGDLDAALDRFRNSLDLRRRLAEGSALPQARRDLVVSFQNVGNVLWMRGDLDGALDGYLQSSELARAVADELGTPAVQRDLALLLEKTATVLRARGDAEAALAIFHESLELRRALAHEGGAARDRRELATTLDAIGITLWTEGDLDGALERHREALAIQRRLVEELATPEARRDLLVALGNVGTLLHGRKELTAALTAHEEGLTLARALADELATPEARRDLAIALGRVGGVLYAEGDPLAALPRFEASHRIYRALAAEVGTPEARRDLATSWGDIGRTLEAQGDTAAALERYAHSGEIAEALADELGTPQAHHDAAVARLLLGNAAAALGAAAAAQAHQRAGLAHAREFLAAQPSAEARELVDYLEGRLEA